jgi:uncharacterized protein
MTPRDSSDADIEALDALCARLAGFDGRVSLEWLDGCMTGLRAGPRAPAPAEWLATLLGDTWERTFADPQDQRQALHTLLGRWQVIDSQLDAQALFDDPDALRLSPLMTEYPIDELVAEGKLSPEEAADLPRLGEDWAMGVLEVIDTFAADWVHPAPGSEDADGFYACLRALEALTLRDDAALQADLKRRHPGRTLSREDLFDEACIAVQDLRRYWVEHAPRHAPRRVVPTPGRNDPCPCGSGKKYKKCHGATPAAH